MVPKSKYISTPSTTKILLVEDDRFAADRFGTALKEAGYEVEVAPGADAAVRCLEKQRFGAAVLDIRMRTGSRMSQIETAGGLRTGLALARLLQTKFKDIAIVGITVENDDLEVERWFRRHKSKLLLKGVGDTALLVNHINDVLRRGRPLPKIFIVHGRDHKLVLALKNYIQNTLNLGEPIILHEQPSHGRTIMEKFEECAADIDVVFVLATPDDVGAFARSSNRQKRPRQNVIFELGYFVGALSRKSGKIVLLQSGPLEIPSDIYGIIHIDVSRGIEAAGEEIRRELKPWLAPRQNSNPL